MNFELSEEDRINKGLVRNFIRDELIPLEPLVLARGRGRSGGADRR